MMIDQTLAQGLPRRDALQVNKGSVGYRKMVGGLALVLDHDGQAVQTRR